MNEGTPWTFHIGFLVRTPAQAWVEETEKGSESQISVAANGESQDFDGFVSFVLEVLLENNSESKAVRRSTDYLLR